jgi:cyclopropane-fatty-acyl-phospholipid synthase
VLLTARHRLANVQFGLGSWAVGRRHYDLGDDLFESMLGRRLVYSCAYWADATDLDAAQEAKLDLVCRKLELGPGMRVLDIGCGWGEALKYAADRYGVSGVGVTVSAHQAQAARRLCAGLPIEIRLADYRTLDERFDRVFSIGMFEHVGPRNHATFFEVVARCLGRDGLALLQTIGTQTGRRTPDPWIERHIFPNSAIPRLDDVVAALRARFTLEDLHNFGLDYVRTLEAWRERFEAAWPRLEPRYGPAFRRVWRYYLAASIASFRTQRTHLWQLVLAPHGREGIYRRPG